MARRRVDRLSHPRRRTISAAVVRSAQIRAAFHDFSRNGDVGLSWIVASLAFAATRVKTPAAGARHQAVRLKPVCGPLPDIACGVLESVSIWRKRSHGRGSFESIGLQVLPRKLALPGVRHLLAAGRKLAAP